MLPKLRNQRMGAIACDKESIVIIDVGQDFREGNSAGSGGASEVIDTAGSGM